MKPKDKMVEQLPQSARDYIALVIREMGYRRKIRLDVQRELEAHFADALQSFTSETEKSEAAQKLITEFGDPKLLAILLRRGKKRCRPLWKKVLIRAGQAVLVLYLISFASNIYVVQSWKNNPRDYLAEFNQQGKKDIAEDKNAYTYYRNASEALTKMPESLETYSTCRKKSGCGKGSYLAALRTMDPGEREILGQWLGENTKAWNLAEEGSRLDYYWWELPEGAFDPHHPNFNFTIEFLSSFRALARLGSWKAVCAFDEGQNQKGIDDLFVVFRMGSHLTKGKILIEYLSGIAMIELAQSQILEAIQEGFLSKQDITTIQKEWENRMGGTEFTLNFESEVLYGLALLHKGDIFRYRPKMYFVPGLHLLLGSRENFDNEGRILIRKLKEFESENSLPHNDQEKKLFRPILPKFLLDITFKATASIVNTHKKFVADFDAFLTILALHRFRMEKGLYPERLSELVADGYLDWEPADPYADGSLRYERRGDDFILYSLGADFEDNGGVEYPENRWGEKENGGGDRVFWPCGN